MLGITIELPNGRDTYKGTKLSILPFRKVSKGDDKKLGWNWFPLRGREAPIDMDTFLQQI